MFDVVEIDDDRFKCGEGHVMRGTWQTKSLECLMNRYTMATLPEGVIDVCQNCEKCSETPLEAAPLIRYRIHKYEMHSEVRPLHVVTIEEDRRQLEICHALGDAESRIKELERQIGPTLGSGARWFSEDDVRNILRRARSCVDDRIADLERETFASKTKATGLAHRGLRTPPR